MHAQDGQAVLEPTNHGKIYYRILTRKNNRFYHVWKVALWHWNQLHVIKFVPTYRHNKHTVITLRGNYSQKYLTDLKKKYARDAKTGVRDIGGIEEVGHASMDYVLNPLYKHPYFHHNYAQLDVTASTTDYHHQVATAEHELGHILGFLHQDNVIHGKKHIMASVQANRVQDIIPLGKDERDTLLHYYH